MNIEKLIENIGKICSWLPLVLVILISFDVFARYLLNFSSASFYELEWHIFAIIFLLGSVYTSQRNEHVRVDVFYNRLSKKNQKKIDLIGDIIFLIPFSLIIFYTSLPFAGDSLRILESSHDPGGLPFRFIIKSIIPLAFLLLGLQGVFRVLKNFKKY